ncbi:hypothetical protein YTPLAS21_05670 [Candidatus Nitrosocosmicus sp.]|jgi:hypothetical protein|uniref:hypothetical protein n=1 Tax=Candidatus Nitrosocosmicus sp. FF01 TaxID=3397670 RepID=UPI002ACC60DB|nr:hypothetical protein YTPLAS21_05670 [Candidatus Nitrosocosmicus sp.]
MSESPILIDEDNKIKIKPELMITENLYPILFENSLFLFFKDENELINCYEVTEKELVEKAQKNPQRILEMLEDWNK